MAGTGKKTDLGLLEEDDEFEEFPAEGRSCILSHYCCVLVCCPTGNVSDMDSCERSEMNLILSA